MRMGGTVENTLKGGETEKRGGKTKILKRGGGQDGSRGRCLKKWGGGGAGTPLQTINKYICYCIIEHNSSLVSFFIPFY